VLILGFGPVSIGLVFTLVIALAFSGGSKLLKLNFMNGFLTGSRPNDYKFLRPSTLMSMLYSLNSM
jgi:hypothetical protein